MLATSLVLVAALLHATWNTLIKFSGERLLVIASMDTVALVFAVLAVAFVDVPPAEIWPWLIASALAEQLYRYLLIKAYRVGDLGLVYPLMRGLSPLVVLGLTLAFAGESLSQQQIIGILLIPCGMACLLWQGGGGDRLPGRCCRWWPDRPVHRLLHLVRRPGRALVGSTVGLPGMADIAQCLAIPAAGQRGAAGTVRPVLANAMAPGAGGGVLRIVQLCLVLWAMHLGSVAEAAALRELSVILVVLLGMRYLKEPFGGPRLLACGLVLAGMLVMKL